MDKAKALYSFWSSFGIPVYDENTVPTDGDTPDFPYITYNTATDSIGNVVLLTASLWYHSSGWQDIERKANEIARYIAKNGHKIVPVDGGYIYITKGSPFAQRMADESDDMIRRMVLNITVEYLTAY